MSSLDEIRRVQRWAPYDNCSAPSILDFPYIGVPPGATGTLIAILVLVYSNICLVILCSRFFLPALSDISERLSSEVVSGTVMTVAASIPELAVSIIGTFFTEEDVGASAIVGSAVFNTLVIPALCALIASRKEGSLVDVWAVSRDSLVYGLSLLCLAIILQKEFIMWYDAMMMVCIYFMYLGGMQIDKFLKRRTTIFYYRIKEDIFESSPFRKMGVETFYGGGPEFFSSCDEAEMKHEVPTGNGKSSWYEKIYNFIVWPPILSMKYSVPRAMPWLSLVACCFWIGVLTYVTSWMITIISYRFGIPDSLMGLTILGIGIGIPELLISLSVAGRGKGTLALSNALGSNIINILLCLGFPWLCKMAVSRSHSILFSNDGLSYSCILMFLMLAILYTSLAINKFVLDKKIGWLLLMLYIIFFIMSALIEMNMFFEANLPLCDISAYFMD